MLYRAGTTGESDLDPYSDDPAFFGGNWPLKTWLAFMKTALDGVPTGRVHRAGRGPDQGQPDADVHAAPEHPADHAADYSAAEHASAQHPAPEHADQHSDEHPDQDQADEDQADDQAGRRLPTGGPTTKPTDKTPSTPGGGQ